MGKRMFVDLSAGAELVEGALGHPWEDVDHRVQPILLVPLSKGDYLEKIQIKYHYEQPFNLIEIVK